MKIIIGTRKSNLALYQTNLVKDMLQKKGIEVEILPIVTTGDKLKDKTLSDFGGKGLFVKEIEEALMNFRCDIAVHSLKDVPFELPRGLKLISFLKREDPRDCLVLKEGKTKEGMVLGTSSLRRKVQIEKIFGNIKVVPIRGNLETRLNKIQTQNLDGVVLAMAGLKRMGLEKRAGHIFDPFELIPAVGQGVIAVEGREGDERVYKLRQILNDRETEEVVIAERVFLETLKGSCKVPIGGFCKKEEDLYHMVSFISNPDGSNFLRIEGIGDDPEELGEGLANNLLIKGADKIIEKI